MEALKSILQSYDPGVIFVLESIFSFDLSLPLNYLLEGFENKILIVQVTILIETTEGPLLL